MGTSCCAAASICMVIDLDMHAQNGALTEPDSISAPRTKTGKQQTAAEAPDTYGSAVLPVLYSKATERADD